MITINTEQGFKHIDSWSDVIENVGYQNNLDPSKHKLDSIIGRYVEKEMVKCGLSNCHKSHAKGYLVKTKSGLSTNIGKDCGKTYFGVDFESMAKQFERDLQMQNNREILTSFNFTIEDVESSLRNMRAGNDGADKLYKKSRELINVGYGIPNVVVKKVNNMIKLSTYVLTKEREATKEEREIALAQNPNTRLPLYFDEPIATIAGLAILQKEYDLKDILVSDIEEGIKSFKNTHVDTMEYDELRRWSKWVGALEGKIEKAQLAINAGRELLQIENLKPFENIIVDKSDMTLFKAFLRTIN